MLPGEASRSSVYLLYSPECVEKELCELRHNGGLRSSLLRTEHGERLPTVMDLRPHAAGQGPADK
jgi:hypothetical protein